MKHRETLRTAAFLATRERLDAPRRRTSRGRLKCVPPNRACGGRCIPPDWDCRLKGEGEDGHLKAVGKGSDPVAGLANVERGLQRIGKGIAKLSLSEIEGGRKAIARGTAKLAPGDLQKKQEIKKNVDGLLGRVLIPATAVVSAGLLHQGLKNFDVYRQGIGREVDDAARSAFNLLRGSIPGGPGARFRARQAAGPEAVAAMERAAASIAVGGPAGTTNPAARPATAAVQAQLNNLDRDLFTAFDQSLRQVDGAPNNRNRPSRLSYTEWQQRSLAAFWDTRRTVGMTPGGADLNGSAFSVHATNTLLARSFGFDAPRGTNLKSEGDEIIGRVSSMLRASGESIRMSMRQAGLNPSDPEAVRGFITRARRGNAADDEAFNTLMSAVTRRQDYQTQARSLYRKTLGGYDDFFRRVAEDTQQAPAIDLVRNRNDPRQRDVLRQRRQSSYFNDAVTAHSAFLGRQLNLPEPVHGTYTGAIARKAYHARFVAGPQRQPGNSQLNITLTPTEARNAGVELSRARNRAEPNTAREALGLLTEAYTSVRGTNGLGSISLVRGSTSRTPSTTTTTTPTQPTRRRRRRLRSRSEIIAMLIRAGRSQAAAETEADRIISERRSDARLDSYTTLRLHLDAKPGVQRLGKPCGQSHIPKAYNCSKGQAEATTSPSESASRDKPKAPSLKAVAAVLAAGTVAATGVYVYKDLKRVEREDNAYAPSPSTRTIIKQSKKEFDTKKSGTAMGNYYTQKSGLKPGDVVYYRSEKDPAAHFGVYLGEGKDGKVRAVMANTNLKRAGFIDVVELGTTKPDSNDVAHFMFPILQKAPKLSNATQLGSDEAVRRALRAVGSDYKFSLTRDNCEVLAHALVYNSPRSQQLERFKRITRQVADSTIGVRQRAVGTIRRARGQKVTEALTAAQIMKRLAKDDSTFLTKDGAQLAREHYSQFFTGRAVFDDARTPASPLIEPAELWTKIKDYPEMTKTVAIRDYLLLVRLSTETDV